MDELKSKIGTTQNHTNGMRPQFKTRWKRRVFLCVSLLILILALYSFRYPIMQGMASYLVHRDQPVNCDVIIVLGGGGAIRAAKAVELVQQGYAGQIMITLPKEAEEEVMDRDLINMESLECQSVFYMDGIDEEKIYWSEEPFYSTYEEARYIREWLLERDYNKAIVVPGLFQSRRAKWTLDHFTQNTGISVLIVPAEGRHVTPKDWWTDIEGIITVENEILKNVYYTFKILFS